MVICAAPTRRTFAFVLFALFIGCGGPLTVGQVRRMDQRGDVEGLLAAWRTQPPTSVLPAVLDGLARHPKDGQAEGIMIEAARGHPNEQVRRTAVQRLAAFDSPGATEALVNALADPFPSVRAQAKASLAARGAAVVNALQVAIRAHGSPLVRASAVELVTRAALRDPALRSAATETLSDRARRDDGPRVRAAAVAGLGELNAGPARSLLIELMRTDDDATVRMVAGRALKKLDVPAPAARTVVAVLPLRNETGEPALDAFANQVADYLMAKLVQADVCTVVNPSKRDAALEELKKVGVQLYDGDRPNAPELGRFALADQFAFGVVQKTDLVYTVVINRMDVSTLELVRGASVSVRGYRPDLDRLKVEAARKFVARFR